MLKPTQYKEDKCITLGLLMELFIYTEDTMNKDSG